MPPPDRTAILDVVTRFCRAFDRHDWKALRALLSDEIEIDYSTFRGDPPRRVLADEYVAARESQIGGVDMLHVTSNPLVEVTGETATCESAFQVLRHRAGQAGGEDYDSFGVYTHTLERSGGTWLIRGIRQHVFFSRGNPAVHGALQPATSR